MTMLLTIDIGNTHIVLGGFCGDKLQFVARMSTSAIGTEDEYAAKLLNVLALHRVDAADIEGAIVASVVPPQNGIVEKAIRYIAGKTPLFVAPGIKTGIQIRCDSPASVGADLICACVAAHHKYGSPSLLIDMGTATKLMLMDETGAFVGAAIIPGVGIGLRALSSGTAQLPQISLSAPKSVIGKNTTDCMRAGVVLGHACMLDGMIDRFSAESGLALPVYATGGLAEVVVPHLTHKITLDPHLVLDGLRIIYEKNVK